MQERTLGGAMCLVRHPHRLEGVQPDSPAVRDYLGLGSLDMVDWRFVEQADVLAGPWSLAARLGNAESAFEGSESRAKQSSIR